MGRVAPAVVLFFLAPLVAEFLLGNLPITMLSALVVLAPMYGGGALLIREGVRRTGRGWPSILVLGLAFGILEEAFTTQTLFNPDYLKLGMRLLEPAYLPSLGIGGWWTVFVLTLHTVWSIATPIALVEALFGERASTPWLGRLGLLVTGLLLAFGAVATTGFTLHGDPFVASASQFAGSATLCGLLIVMAFTFPPRGRAQRAAESVPNGWRVGAGSLAAGSAFLLVPNTWGWWAVATYLTVDLAAIGVVTRWSHRGGWNGRHRLALAGGATMAYAWHAFPQAPVVGGADAMTDLVGNLVFALGAIVLLVIAARRNRLGAQQGSTRS
jgi:hypothetical protein